MSARTAAIGFTAHSGWAAMVVIGGTAAAPSLLDRSRVLLTDDHDPDAKQPYHAVEFLCVEEATGRLDAYMAVATRMAQASIQAQSEKLKQRGIALKTVGVVDSSSRKHIALPSILASHALIHAAEGDHFRNALSVAAEQLRLEVFRLPARALEDHAVQCLQLSLGRLLDSVNGLGREAGPPWGADQKKAALLAWTLLTEKR
ncbi:MAG TPA: hypothetical protein VGI90_20590 [Steroidobacteraceae bacterium]|jgi:hypothetical protein